MEGGIKEILLGSRRILLNPAKTLGTGGEADVYDIMGNQIDTDKTIVLDLESINILGPGKYELDLVNLFKKKHPLIYKLEEGKYMVDLVESFKKIGEH